MGKEAREVLIVRRPNFFLPGLSVHLKSVHRAGVGAVAQKMLLEIELLVVAGVEG